MAFKSWRHDGPSGGEMGGVHRSDGFQFNEDGILDKQIRHITSDGRAAVSHINGTLLLNHESPVT